MISKNLLIHKVRFRRRKTCQDSSSLLCSSYYLWLKEFQWFWTRGVSKFLESWLCLFCHSLSPSEGGGGGGRSDLIPNIQKVFLSYFGNVLTKNILQCIVTRMTFFSYSPPSNMELFVVIVVAGGKPFFKVYSNTGMMRGPGCYDVV